MRFPNVSPARLERAYRDKAMPERFEPLARYNAEVARGLVHTDEWRERMAALQADFDAYTNAARLTENL